MNDNVTQNLDMVRDEVKGMLDNIERIKGQKYRKHVEHMFISHQIMEIITISNRFVRDQDPRLAKVLISAAASNMAAMLQNYYDASGFAEKDLDGLIQEADTIIKNSHNMAVSALNAGLDGRIIKE